MKAFCVYCVREFRATFNVSASILLNAEVPQKAKILPTREMGQAIWAGLRGNRGCFRNFETPDSRGSQRRSVLQTNRGSKASVAWHIRNGSLNFITFTWFILLALGFRK
jgi:hypothetical protein